MNRDVSDEQTFNFDTTNTLRGLAILLLIIGHFSNQCIERGFLPTYWAGRWAIIIFLFISGIGLTNKYMLGGSVEGFLKRRVKRLIPALWITLSLSYLLGYWLSGMTFSTRNIIIHFLGIISPEPPNGPLWFISYILYLYLVVFIALLPNINNVFRCFIILFFSYVATGSIILSLIVIPELGYLLFKYFGMWMEYTIVFPVATLIGVYQKRVMSFLKWLMQLSPSVYVIVMLTFVLLFRIHPGIAPPVEQYSEAISSMTLKGELIETLIPIYLILSLLMLSYLLNVVRVQSKLLQLLGKYSYEIYLLHWPFMVHYDLFLFRRPLVLYFFVYLFFIIMLGYLLRKGALLLSVGFELLGSQIMFGLQRLRAGHST